MDIPWTQINVALLIVVPLVIAGLIAFGVFLYREKQRKRAAAADGSATPPANIAGSQLWEKLKDKKIWASIGIAAVLLLIAVVFAPQIFLTRYFFIAILLVVVGLLFKAYGSPKWAKRFYAIAVIWTIGLIAITLAPPRSTVAQPIAATQPGTTTAAPTTPAPAPAAAQAPATPAAEVTTSNPQQQSRSWPVFTHRPAELAPILPINLTSGTGKAVTQTLSNTQQVIITMSDLTDPSLLEHYAFRWRVDGPVYYALRAKPRSDADWYRYDPAQGVEPDGAPIWGAFHIIGIKPGVTFTYWLELKPGQ